MKSQLDGSPGCRSIAAERHTMGLTLAYSAQSRHPMTEQTPDRTSENDGPIASDANGLVPTQLESTEPTTAPVVRQLDSIIDNLAGFAVPVLREIAARAADLAAKAGEAAGPMAHKAAEKTEEVGGRLATKGREVAADIRRDADTTPLNPATTEPETQEPAAAEAGLPPR
jgi:hypothetical protein